MQLKNRRLTPLQGALVLLAIGALGGLLYVLRLGIVHLKYQRAVRASIPKYLEGLRTQRDVLIGAIERYHAQFGFYPTSKNPGIEQRAALNPLFYELFGTAYVTNNGRFRVPNAKETIDGEKMQSVFNMRSFSNSLTYPQWPTNFLAGLSAPGREVDGIILLSYSIPEDVDIEVDDAYNISTWRYNANAATHNPKKFDLWVEVKVLDKTFTVGNWDAAR